MTNNIPRQGDIYKHYKGNLYQITSVAMHTETEEMLVVYQALYGEYKYYARPLNMFMDQVNKDGRYINRFTLINFYNSSKEESYNLINNICVEPETEKVYGLMDFLDAKTYTDKMNILKEIKHNGNLNKQILRNCAMSIDCVVEEDDIEEQYNSIMNCLKMHSQFECTRLR